MYIYHIAIRHDDSHGNFIPDDKVHSAETESDDDSSSEILGSPSITRDNTDIPEPPSTSEGIRFNEYLTGTMANQISLFESARSLLQKITSSRQILDAQEWPDCCFHETGCLSRGSREQPTTRTG
jgi:hypothetical protein